MNQQNKELYRKICKEGLRIPIFHQPDWLDAACGADQWQVALLAEQENIRALLPFPINKKWGITVSQMPPLTPYLGLWLDPNMSPEEKKSRKSLTNLLKQLPSLNIMAIRNVPDYSGSLDWIWQNWELETKYTLEIPAQQSVALEDLKGTLRNDIKKAASQLTLSKSDDYEILYALILESFSRNKTPVPFSLKQLKDFHLLLQKNKWGQIFVAKDQEGEIIAGHYFIWDQDKVYNWISGYKKKDNIRGATQLILHEGIKNAVASNKIFDFEGGLIPGIGNMYKSFPVVEVPYLVSRKFKNKWIKSLWSLRN